MAWHEDLTEEYLWSLFAHPSGRHHIHGTKVRTWRLTSICLLRAQAGCEESIL